MAVAVVVTLTIATTVGFLLGYRLARWKSMEHQNDYDSSTYNKSRSTNHLDIYNHHHPSSKLNDNHNHHINLMLTLPDCKNEKNLLTLNNGTLPKDYKVKKVYL